MAVLAPTALDGRGDVVVDSQSGPHASKHRLFDALMSMSDYSSS
jgi:hypothetical protein